MLYLPPSRELWTRSTLVLGARFPSIRLALSTPRKPICQSRPMPHSFHLVLLSSSVISRRLFADVLLVLSLNAGKDYLLADVGVFWVLVRVLACGGLVSMIWLATSGQSQAKRVTEVRAPCVSLSRPDLKRELVVGCGYGIPTAVPSARRTLHSPLPLASNSVRLPPYARPDADPHVWFSVILFTHFSPIWFKALTSFASVSTHCGNANIF